MATMGMIKAAVVAVAFAGSMGTALAAEPTGEQRDAHASQAAQAAGIDGSGQESGLQAYCYWETYCDFYGYCWTNWVCF